MARGVKIGWVSSETPDRYGQGGQRRQYHLIRELARAGFDVSVAHYASEQDSTTIRSIVPTVGLRPFGRGPIGRVRNRTWSRFDSWVREVDPDILIVAHAVSARLLPGTLGRGDVPSLIDFHNVDSRWLSTIGHLAEAERARALERRLLQRMTPIVCSMQERSALLDDERTCLVVPQGADPDEWPTPQPPRSDRCVVTSFGSLWYGPHRESVAWFLQQVWPLVRAAVPNAEFRLLGPGDTSGFVDLANGVVASGKVGDLAAAVADANVVVVPTLGGPGSRVKFPESVMSGRPVVATRVAAEGFLADGRFDQVDDPVAMATAISRLLGDSGLADLQGRAARQHALATLSWASAAQHLVDYLASPEGWSSR